MTILLCVIAYLLVGVLCVLVMARNGSNELADALADGMGILIGIAWPIAALVAFLVFDGSGWLTRYRAKHRRSP